MIKKITISTAEPEKKVMGYLEIDSLEKAIYFVQMKSENESAENLLHQMYNVTFADPVGAI